jgi:transposase
VCGTTRTHGSEGRRSQQCDLLTRHLLRNSGDALRGVLEHHYRHLAEVVRSAASLALAEPVANDNNTHDADVADGTGLPSLNKAERRSQEARGRRQARFEEVVRLHAQGMPIKAVARTLGIERKTVRRWLRAGRAPSWLHADRGRSILDPFRDHLEARWTAGYRNGAGLWREIRDRGFAGQEGVVEQWAARRRRNDRLVERTPSAKPPAKSAPPPTTRKAARMLMSEPDKLNAEEHRFTTALLELSPPIAQAVDLTKGFSTIIKQGLADQLDGWISAAEDSGFKGFARSLRQNVEAIYAALTLLWSTGPVEEQTNRLKVVKRTMYGRAGFDLLRSRVMAAA